MSVLRRVNTDWALVNAVRGQCLLVNYCCTFVYIRVSFSKQYEHMLSGIYFGMGCCVDSRKYVVPGMCYYLSHDANQKNHK